MASGKTMASKKTMTALTALLSLLLAQPAQANDLTGFFRQFLKLNDGHESRTPSDKGSLASPSIAAAAKDGRPGRNMRIWIKHLMSRVEQGRSDGRLTINESSLFMDQLNGLRAREAHLIRSNRMSGKEYGQLVSRMSRLDNLISSALQSRQYTGRSIKSSWY